MKKTLAVLLLTATVISLTGCAGNQFHTFQDASDTCFASSGVQVSDNGTTLTVDMMGEEEITGATYDDLVCVVDEVGTPAFIKDEMWATRAIDGRQSEEFDGISVKWSYSPANGMNLTYHKQ